MKLGNELPWVRPGRHPLRTWFLVRGPGEIGPLTDAVAVTTALSVFHGLEDVHTRIARLTELFASVPAYAIWYANADELVDQVMTALG